MKFLLTEDDVHVAFEADGYETTIRHTGEHGLACLARPRPDPIVLDVRLPAINGAGVLREIRSTIWLSGSSS
jgi:DNA-binding response OmpR family regulator